MEIWKEIKAKNLGRISINCVLMNLGPTVYSGLVQHLYISFSEDYKLYILPTYIGKYRRNRAMLSMIGTEYLVISVV